MKSEGMNNWKEGDLLPPPSNQYYSEEINKAILSVRFWKKINGITIGILAFFIIIFFTSLDASIMPHNNQGEIPLLIWLPNELLKISGVVFLAILEDKAFEKLIKKRFPLAYY